jgi:hypothetical protein
MSVKLKDSFFKFNNSKENKKINLTENIET